MKLIAFSTGDSGGTESFGVVKDDGVVDVGSRLPSGITDIKSAIAQNAFAQVRTLAENHSPDHALTDVKTLKPIALPEKTICIGINYVNRNAEYRDNSTDPTYPSVFMRCPNSLVAHGANIVRPPESEQLDYEGEIVIVIGKTGRRIKQENAVEHIAGLTIMNEGTIRDWLRHAKFNVTQGKNFDQTGSIGPWMVTIDQFENLDDLHIETSVNGELRQKDSTANLLFPFRYLVSYVSTFTTLKPGDIIATGTPNGAGARFDPPKYLVPGDRIEVAVKGIGTLTNSVIDETV